MSHSIATRTGDDGTTSLLYGQRVPKDHPQIETVGSFDELNVAIGLARVNCRYSDRRVLLQQIQKDLVALMGEIACAEQDTERYLASKFTKIGKEAVTRIDAAIAELEAKGLKFDGWATPGANAHAAALDFARATARRAERRVISLSSHGRNVRPVIKEYINRVSDALWLLAREAEQ